MNNDLDKHVGAYEGKTLFDFDNEIMLTWYAERIVKMNVGAGSILELGLGHGHTTRVFSAHFPRHLVLDGSPAVISNFRERFSQCPAEIKEVYFEEFETEECFDVIVLGFILEHVEDPHSILKYYRKFLKKGGSLYISVPNAEVLNRRLGHIAKLLPDMQQLSENDVLLGHRRFYTVKTLQDEIRAAGYEVTALEGIYLKPFTSSQMLSLNLNKSIIDALCTVGIDYPELSCGLLAEVK